MKKITIFAALLGIMSACTMFKVVTGRVEYKDPNHEFTTSVDTLLVVKNSPDKVVVSH